MKQLFRSQIFLRLLLIGVLILSLTLSPRPRQMQIGFMNAYQAIQKPIPAQAARWLTVILAFEPWRTDLRLEAGRYAAQAGDYSAAVELLEQVEQIQGLPAQDWQTLGDAYHALEEDTRAVFAWEKALKLGADQLSIMQRLLAIHAAQGDAAAATQDIKILADLQPTDAQAQALAGLRLSAEDPLSALPYLEKAAELDDELALKVGPLRDVILNASRSDDPSYLLLAAGRQLAVLENWDLASQAFTRAVQIRPDFGEAWAFLAESLQHQGDQEQAQAKDALDQAFKTSPNSVLVHLMASLYWQRLGDDAQAQDQLQKALSLEPENAVIYVEIGNILARNGDLQEARQFFQKAVALDPQEIPYRRALVDFLLHHQLELRESALPVARQAVLLSPNDPAALDLLGETLFLLGDYHTAGRFVERALRLDAEYAPALMHLGVISIFLGDNTKALQLLTQARDLASDQPTRSQAQRLLEYYFP
jgi:tetratricopeptide (TPR) repeat protein